MPEKPEKAKQEEQKPKSKLPVKTLIVVLGVLLLEGGTISLFMIMRGGPQQAGASDPIDGAAAPVESQMVEVPLAEDFGVDNYMGGRTRLVVTMTVTAKVKKEKADELKTRAAEHQTEILDSMRSLISSTPLDHVKDPKLQVLKREIKLGIERIIGEGYIEEILVPSWQTYTAD